MQELDGSESDGPFSESRGALLEFPRGFSFFPASDPGKRPDGNLKVARSVSEEIQRKPASGSIPILMCLASLADASGDLAARG